MPNRLFCGCCDPCDKRTHTFTADESGLANWHLIDADAGAITAAQTNGEIREGVTVLSKTGLLPNADGYSYDLILDGRQRLTFPIKFRMIAQASVATGYGYGEPALGDHVFGEYEILNTSNDVDDLRWTVRVAIGQVVSGIETIFDTSFREIVTTINANIHARICRAYHVTESDEQVPYIVFRVASVAETTLIQSEELNTGVFAASLDLLESTPMTVIGDDIANSPTGLHVGYKLITDSDTDDEPRVRYAYTQRSQSEALEDCVVCVPTPYPCPCDLETEKVVWSEHSSDVDFTVAIWSAFGFDYYDGPTDWKIIRCGPSQTGRNLCEIMAVRLSQMYRPVNYNVLEERVNIRVTASAETVTVVVGCSISNHTGGNSTPYDLQALLDAIVNFSAIASNTIHNYGIKSHQISRDLWDCGNFNVDAVYNQVGTNPLDTVNGTSVYVTDNHEDPGTAFFLTPEWGNFTTQGLINELGN